MLLTEEDDADAFDGVEGVAILSKFDVLDTEALFLPDASKRNDPRKQRLALRVRVRCPTVTRTTPLDAVVVHLDAFAGRSSRVEQFRAVLDAYAANRRDAVPTVVGGDLNTHNHGLVALHPGLTGDDYWLHRLLRFGSSSASSSSSSQQPQQHKMAWGQTEAEWWQEHVFDPTTLVDPFDKSNASGTHNTFVTVGGLKLWGGKLDWLLYDATYFACLGKHISDAGLASDHPYLRLDLALRDDAHRRHQQELRAATAATPAEGGSAAVASSSAAGITPPAAAVKMSTTNDDGATNGVRRRLLLLRTFDADRRAAESLLVRSQSLPPRAPAALAGPPPRATLSV